MLGVEGLDLSDSLDFTSYLRENSSNRNVCTGENTVFQEQCFGDLYITWLLFILLREDNKQYQNKIGNGEGQEKGNGMLNKRSSFL